MYKPFEYLLETIHTSSFCTLKSVATTIWTWACQKPTIHPKSNIINVFLGFLSFLLINKTRISLTFNSKWSSFPRGGNGQKEVGLLRVSAPTCWAKQEWSVRIFKFKSKDFFVLHAKNLFMEKLNCFSKEKGKKHLLLRS